MQKKILVVDDSALMRRVVCDIINSNPEFNVEDIAKDGLEALNFLTSKQYDVVVLDINMPKMDGLELLRQLKKYKISPKIIMNSTLTMEGSKETILALELGALDFVTKPGNLIEAKGVSFKTELLEAVSMAAKARVRTMPARTAWPRTVVPQQVKTAEKPILRSDRVGRSAGGSGKKIIALACSTGGPKALHEVIPLLPKSLPIPVLVVQHMPAGFTKSLAMRLDELSMIEVKEAEEGETLRNGCVYIAPGGRHMTVAKNRSGQQVIKMTDLPPREGVRPCANYMYESLADSSYEEIICVVLTGMGADGTKGIKELDKKKKTYVIAQDEDSCVVFGMPKAVLDSGLVNELVSLQKIAESMVRATTGSR